MSAHQARGHRPTAASTGGVAEAASPAPAPAAPVPLPATAGGLQVGHADDPAERLADRLADTALRRLSRPAPERDDTDADADGGPDAGVDPHRHTPGCGHLRRSAAAVRVPGAVVGPEGGGLPDAVSGRIEAARGGGAPLAGAERTRMESAFGRSLGHVRLHRGGEAARLNDALSAEAFTVGDDVFLGSGAAAGPRGEGVLAHELGHVLSEPGAVRRQVVRRYLGESAVNRITSLFGKRELTPEEQREREEEKAEKQRREDEAKARKRNVKNSKKLEKTEVKELATSRKEGKKGRAALTSAIYDDGPGGESEHEVLEGPANANGVGPMEQSGAQARMTAVQKRFEEAREHEIGLFRFLQLGNGRRGTAPLSEEEAADQAYHQTWHVKFRDLESVRPPRETAAERLVIQVRRVRTEGNVQQAALVADTTADDATISLRMLGKNVELAYERMVTLRDQLIAKEPTLHPAIAQDKAAVVIRGSLAEKIADEMPPKDGALDVAAWAQAGERVAAKQRQAVRDRDSIESSLMLLPEDKRDKQREKLGGNAGASDSLATGAGYVDKINSYGGMGLTAVNTIGGGIAGQIGKGQDKDLREQQGLTKPSHGTVLPAKLDQGVSQLVHDVNQSKDWQAKGLRNGPDALPMSEATKVKTGFGQVTDILSSLLGAVQSAFAMVRSTKAAWDNDDAYEGLKATKSGAAGLSGLVSAAKSTAGLAKLIDAGVSEGVGKVVPGLDIASAVLGIVRATMDVAMTGMRQRETDVSMFEARAQSTTKVHVTVYPLMKVSQVYTKQLENSCWSLGSGIGDLVLSIAQLASGGGYGIPLAIKAGKAVLDNLHSLGHFIADQVLAVMAKKAQKESEVQHLEGAAEQELSRHPKMAVDGIVVRAAQGDPAALKFLSYYRIDGKPITADYVRQIKPSSIRPGADPDTEDSQSALLARIRAAVLGGMNTAADPKTAYDEIMDKVDQVGDLGSTVATKATGLATTWNETGTLAKQRNTLAGQGRLGSNSKSDRGLGWRIRMFVSSEKRGKLTQRTKAYEEMVPMPPGVICAVAGLALGRNASDSELDDFADQLTLADLEAELARKPRRNSPAGIELIRDLITLKSTSASPVAAGVGP